MRYANIIMTREGRITIGDDIQLIAIENLYKYMGIDYNSVVRIPFNQLSTYKGEYVVLPISFPLHGYSHGTAITQYSDRIIPVFLGYSILTEELDEAEISYLKKYEPIGCRDNFTLNVLRKHGIISYLNGCMTATFPLRDYNKTYDKIYCVDISDKLKQYIPKEILDKAIFTEHVYMSDECPNHSSESMAKKVYGEYWENAKLVITTRLHAALPCLSRGIPVILAKERPSFRFAFLSKLIPIYSSEEYEMINWNPAPVNIEEIKSKILSYSAQRVKETYNRYSKMMEISEYYESVDEKRFSYFEAIDDAIEYITEHYKQEDSFEYTVWSITQTADYIIKYIVAHYPNAKLNAVIDRREGVMFHGISSTSKQWLVDNGKNTLCFVCAPSAMVEAKEFFSSINHTLYYMCWTDGLSR